MKKSSKATLNAIGFLILGIVIGILISLYLFDISFMEVKNLIIPIGAIGICVSAILFLFGY